MDLESEGKQRRYIYYIFLSILFLEIRESDISRMKIYVLIYF